MKVLGGDNFDSDIDEQAQQKKKPRDAKALRKQDFTGSQPLTTSKIGKLVRFIFLTHVDRIWQKGVLRCSQFQKYTQASTLSSPTLETWKDSLVSSS